MSRLSNLEPKKIRLSDYYKRFAKGEQNIKLEDGRLYIYDKQYYWEETDTYNFILPIIESNKEELKDKNIYGKNGLVAQLEPYQRAYNKVMCRQMEMVNRINLDSLMVEDGSADIDSLEEDGFGPGKVLVYRQGARPPTLVSVLPESYKCLEDMRKHIFEMVKTIVYSFTKKEIDELNYIM